MFSKKNIKNLVKILLWVVVEYVRFLSRSYNVGYLYTIRYLTTIRFSLT